MFGVTKEGGNVSLDDYFYYYQLAMNCADYFLNKDF